MESLWVKERSTCIVDVGGEADSRAVSGSRIVDRGGGGLRSGAFGASGSL
jgi:hypothetical protein